MARVYGFKKQLPYAYRHDGITHFCIGTLLTRKLSQ
jgi:hypothetical protein